MTRLLIRRAVSEHDGIAFTDLAESAAVVSDMYEIGLAEDADGGVVAVVAEAYEMDVANALANALANVSANP